MRSLGVEGRKKWKQIIALQKTNLMKYFIWVLVCCTLIACGGGHSGERAAAPVGEKNEPTLPVKEMTDSALAGSWVLSELPQSPTPFSKLYPRQRPTIFIQPELKLISGSTGCNRFSATITTVGNQLRFTDFTRSTLTCMSDAESIFLTAWEKSERFFFRNNDELIWGTDSVSWMVFNRR